MGLGNTGSFSGTLSTSSLGYSNLTPGGFGGGTFRAGGGVGGASAASLDTSAARFAGVASSNPFGSYYSNPLSAGVSSTGRATVGFGSPLYTLANTSSQLTGGVGSAGVMTGNLESSAGYSSASMYRPTYAVGDYPAPVTSPSNSRILTPVPARSDLQQVLKRSTSLSSNSNFQVLSDGRTIVLRGTAVSEHDRLLAEGLLRLSPGVSEVLNQVSVQPAAGGSGGSQ
jgi:hypothetical protein